MNLSCQAITNLDGARGCPWAGTVEMYARDQRVIVCRRHVEQYMCNHWKRADTKTEAREVAKP